MRSKTTARVWETWFESWILKQEWKLKIPFCFVWSLTFRWSTWEVWCASWWYTWIVCTSVVRRWKTSARRWWETLWWWRNVTAATMTATVWSRWVTHCWQTARCWWTKLIVARLKCWTGTDGRCWCTYYSKLTFSIAATISTKNVKCYPLALRMVGYYIQEIQRMSTEAVQRLHQAHFPNHLYQAWVDWMDLDNCNPFEPEHRKITKFTFLFLWIFSHFHESLTMDTRAITRTPGRIVRNFNSVFFHFVNHHSSHVIPSSWK